MKWADWKDDVKYHEAYIAYRTDTTDNIYRTALPLSADNWPIATDQVVKRVVDQEEFNKLDRNLEWSEVKSMREIDNIYDVGLWRNLRMVLKPMKV